MNRTAPENSKLRGSADRRAEARRQTEGAGWIEPLESGEAHAIRLMDVSPSGFRARHSFLSLSAGQTVRFRHIQAAGTAMVMWNRILGDDVESGFLIVSRPA